MTSLRSGGTFPRSRRYRSTEDCRLDPLSGCPANITQASAAGPLSVTWNMPNATDSCEGVLPVSCTPTNGSSFAVGVTAVTCRASDSSGNASTCSFTVTILNTQGPRITHVEVLGRDVLVSFTTESGMHYALQQTGNIGAGVWNDVVAGINGNGSVLTVTDSGGATHVSGFYRVRVTP